MPIAGQDGGKVGVRVVDPKTGLGTETGATVKISRAVCVKFVLVAR